MAWAEVSQAQWFSALEDLKHDRLDLGAIATAVHRGIMQDAGLLVASHRRRDIESFDQRLHHDCRKRVGILSAPVRPGH